MIPRHACEPLAEIVVDCRACVLLVGTTRDTRDKAVNIDARASRVDQAQSGHSGQFRTNL